jgi:hypothetical protein
LRQIYAIEKIPNYIAKTDDNKPKNFKPKKTSIMKKLSLIFSIVLCTFLSITAKAQTATDYFPGKWNVVIMGTPQGDAKMTFLIERKDGKLTGAVQDTTGAEISKLSKVEEKDKTITAYFTAQNYDVSLVLEPIDDDHVKGNLLGMFDAKGVRVKESK